MESGSPRATRSLFAADQALAPRQFSTAQLNANTVKRLAKRNIEDRVTESKCRSFEGGATELGVSEISFIGLFLSRRGPMAIGSGGARAGRPVQVPAASLPGVDLEAGAATAHAARATPLSRRKQPVFGPVAAERLERSPAPSRAAQRRPARQNLRWPRPLDVAKTNRPSTAAIESRPAVLNHPQTGRQSAALAHAKRRAGDGTVSAPGVVRMDPMSSLYLVV